MQTGGFKIPNTIYYILFSYIISTLLWIITIIFILSMSECLRHTKNIYTTLIMFYCSICKYIDNVMITKYAIILY